MAASPLSRLWRRFVADPEARLLDLVVLAVCAVALYHGLRATAGLSWPPDVDLYRDMGAAQSILDGHPLADPLYRDQWLWYNPLVPTLIAGVAALFGAPVHLVATHLGAYANLLAPLCFYLLATRLFGRRVGAAAALCLVLLPAGRFPAWASASYSPWLFPNTLVQALFYLGLLALLGALRRPSPLRFAGFGALLGLTFLGHTAPALLLGICGLGATLWTLLRPGPGPRAPRLRPLLGGLALALGVALLVSAPYSGVLLFHHGLEVQNPEPSRWIWAVLDLQHLGAFLRANLTPSLGLCAAGLLLLPWRRPGLALLGLWLLGAGAFLGYSYLWQHWTAAGREAPVLVPGHHFLLYLKALEKLLAGLALAGAAALLGRGLAALLRRPALRSRLELGVLLALLGLTATLSYPIFRSREAFTTERLKAKILRPSDARMDLFRWILAETEPTDVFLADDHDSLHLISPAGRKVVAMLPTFSNPFAPWKERHELRHQLFSMLSLRRKEPFFALARQVNLSYVLLEGPQAMVVYGSWMGSLERVQKAGKLNVFKLIYPKDTVAESNER